MSGVPEQGLREPEGTLNRRLKRIADEMPALRDFIRAAHGPIGWEHTLSIWATDLQKIVAALERPRPALPPLEILPHDDPTPFDVIAGLAVACGEARVREEYRLAAGGERRYTPLPEETKLFDMLDRAHLGAALPPQIGNPAPDATNFGLLTCALELLTANEREYAPSNAATDWYLRDQRVIALLREVLVRGNL